MVLAAAFTKSVCLAKKAGMSQSIAGLFLEAHPDPDQAKCDGPCALPLSVLDEFLTQIKDLDDFVKDQNDLEIS